MISRGVFEFIQKFKLALPLINSNAFFIMMITMLVSILLKACVCEFGFNVAFNNFAVISRHITTVSGCDRESSMLTFIVLPH